MNIVEQVRQQGFAYAGIEELFPHETWEAVSFCVDEWVASPVVQEYITAYLAHPLASGDVNLDKEYMARLLHGFDQEPYAYDVGDPFLEMALEGPFLEMARAYFDGQQPVLTYYDLWHHFPVPNDPQGRSGSQQWHRDGEAHGNAGWIFKVFLYFTDVDEEGAGPFEMFLSPQQKVICWRPRGGLLFTDTGNRLHRGGYCTTKPRTCCAWYYHSPEMPHVLSRYNLTEAAREQYGDGGGVLSTVSDRV